MHFSHLFRWVKTYKVVFASILGVADGGALPLNMEEHKRVWQGTMADYWFDEDGVLHAITKDAPRTVENLSHNFDLVHEIIGGKKVCVILDNTFTQAYDMKALNHLLKEYKDAFRAIAFVSRSAIGKMLGTISCELIPFDTIPMKVFESTEEAKEWIRKYL
jgi:hypothetical protein